MLTLKHWHLFLLIVICGAWISPSPLREIINAISVLTFSLWIYAIGIYGQQRIAQLGMKPMNLQLFKINMVFVTVLLLLMLYYLSTNPDLTASERFIGTAQYAFALTVSLYLLFAMVQTIAFTCKTMAMLELRREVSFGDYFKNLLLMLFLFIGIWIFQPKLNRQFA